MARSIDRRTSLRGLAIAVALAAAVASSPSAAGGAELPAACPASQPSLAIARLSAAYDGAGIDLGAAVAAQLLSALHATRCFALYERSELASLLGERELAAAGASERAAWAPLGAPTWIVFGSVSAAAPERRGRRFGLSVPFPKLPMDVDFGGSRSQAEVALDLRVVDAASGRVLAVLAARGASSTGGSFVALDHEKLGASADGFSNAPLGDAARAAAANAAEQLVAAARGVLDPASER
jgi:curli biogenesis system outer membrane secretion channel CsgG